MTAAGDVFTVNGTLHLYDCSGNVGTIKHENSSVNMGSGVNVAAGGTFYMHGGTITGNQATYAGGVHVEGDFTMNGGSISGNSVDGSKVVSGSGVYVKGTFTMNGGTIENNTSSMGFEGVCVAMGSFTMAGGTIRSSGEEWMHAIFATEAEQCTISKDAVVDGYIAVHSCSLTISGGTLSNGTLKLGNGSELRIQGGEIAMSIIIISDESGKGGTISISGGRLTGDVYGAAGTLNMSGGTLNGNVVVRSDTFTMTDGTLNGKVTVTSGTFNMTGGTLTGGLTISGGEATIAAGAGTTPQVGGTIEKTGGTLNITDGYFDEAAKSSIEAGNWLASNLGLALRQAGEAEVFQYELAPFSHTHKDVTFDQRFIMPSNGQLAAGKYCLTVDFTINTSIVIPAETEVWLCLNGHSITMNAEGDVFTVNGTLHLYDCTENLGTIKHENSSVNMGSGVNVAAGSTFYMYGGTITSNMAKFGGGVNVGGTFNMYGGAITGNIAGIGGGVNVGGGSFTMSNGSITGNWTEAGGEGVYVGSFMGDSGSNSTFTMEGGTITGMSEGLNSAILTNSADQITICDDAVVEGNVEVSSCTVKMTGGTVNGRMILSGGMVDMTGGTITGSITVKSGTFNMTGGTISVANTGTGVSVTGGTFNMSGGTIEAGADGTGVSFMSGTFAMSGGYLGGTWRGMFRTEVSFTGGYLSQAAKESLEMLQLQLGNYTFVTLDSAQQDKDYVEGYPYAIYESVATAVSAVPSRATYDGEEIAAGEDFTLDGLGGSPMPPTYSWASSSDSGTGLPTNAGTYTITMTVTEYTDYTLKKVFGESSNTFDITIARAQVEAVASLAQTSREYDGTTVVKIALSGITGIVNGDFELVATGSVTSGDASSIEKTVTVTYSFGNVAEEALALLENNYILPAKETLSSGFTITPRAVAFEWTMTEQQRTYDGEKFEWAGSATGVDEQPIEVKYAYRNTVTSEDLSSYAPKNVGSYSVTAVSADTNYTINADSATVTFTIAPRPVAFEWTMTERNRTYDGNRFALTGSATGVDGNSIAVDYTYKNTVTSEDLSYFAPINAGEYSVTVASADANYTITEASATVNFTISKKGLTAEMFTIDGQTFTGSKLTPQLKYLDGGLLKESDYAAEYGANRNAGENAGSVTITATLNGNYTGSVTKYFDIEKATMSYHVQYTDAWTYTGKQIKALEVIVFGTRGDEEYMVEYKSGDGAYSTTYPTFINAGAYSVSIRVTAANHHTVEVSKPFTISPKELTEDMFTLSGTYAYNGSAQEVLFDYADPDEFAVLTSGDFTISYADNIAVGRASVTFTGTGAQLGEGNYTGSVTKYFDIGKGTYDMSGVRFEDATFVEDGTEKSIFITGSLPAGVSVSYVGNGNGVVGVYEVTAQFAGDENNYFPIADMTATLTINRAMFEGSVGDMQPGDAPQVVVTEEGAASPTWSSSSLGSRRTTPFSKRSRAMRSCPWCMTCSFMRTA